MASKIYDAQDMQRALNSLDNALSEVQKALTTLGSVNLGSLTGEARNAMEKQISKQIEVLKQQQKTLQTSRGIIQSKIKGLQ